MNYLPLVHGSSVYLNDKTVFSGTLGQAIRWMRERPVAERDRFAILVQHHPEPISFEAIEMIARRTGSLGDNPVRLSIAA
jgi:hypothetical protein